jgi:[ribosomal protein S5]-alanine N-acetyltransferase
MKLSSFFGEHWLRFGFGYWVVRRRDSATPTGFCGIKVMQLNDSDVVNLFYRFDPAVWGNGLASEAASAVIGRLSLTLVLSMGVVLGRGHKLQDCLEEPS